MVITKKRFGLSTLFALCFTALETAFPAAVMYVGKLHHASAPTSPVEPVHFYVDDERVAGVAFEGLHHDEQAAQIIALVTEVGLHGPGTEQLRVGRLVSWLRSGVITPAWVDSYGRTLMHLLARYASADFLNKLSHSLTRSEIQNFARNFSAPDRDRYAPADYLPREHSTNKDEQEKRAAFLHLQSIAQWPPIHSDTYFALAVHQ